MRKMTAKLAWCENNYCAVCEDGLGGSVIVTDKSYEGVKEAFAKSLRFHIEGLLKDGDKVPEWMAEGRYRIEYEVDISAILKAAQRYTTLSSISRATGINERLLYQYANYLKHPRPVQAERIREGICTIGNALLSVYP